MLPRENYPSNPHYPQYPMTLYFRQHSPLKPAKVKTMVLTFSRLFFVFPLNENLESTVFLKIHSIASQTLLIILGTSVHIYIRNKEILYRKSTDSISYAMLYISETVCSLVLLVHNMILIKDGEKIKNCVKSNNVRVRETFGVHTTALLLSCVIKYVVAACLFLIIRKPWRYLEEIFFTMLDVQTFLVIFQFCFFVSVVKTKLTSVAEEVGPYRADCSLHFELVGRLRDLNRTYGWQLLVVVFRIFTQCLLGMYWIVQAARRWSVEMSDEWSHILSMCSSISVVLTGAYKMWLLINVCASTSEAVQKFNYNLLVNMRRSTLLSANMKICLYANMNHNITFTAAGFFNLDRPLATSMLTTAMTYLVVMEQFTKK